MDSEQQLLADAAQAIADGRQASAGVIPALKTIQASAAVDRIMAAATQPDARELTPKEAAAKAERERLEVAAGHRGAYIAQRGRRYGMCRVANFYADGAGGDAKVAAKEALFAYLSDWESNYAKGFGVTLYGPVGTGKDHLAAAVCHHAIDCGLAVEWVDGMTLFAELRRSFDADSRDTETRIIDRYKLAAVLCISDPLPVSGELTDFQASALLRIIDGRYNDFRPTIITVNVAGGEEARRRLTPAIHDRIRHVSLAVNCNWPSYRTSH